MYCVCVCMCVLMCAFCGPCFACPAFLCILDVLCTHEHVRRCGALVCMCVPVLCTCAYRVHLDSSQGQRCTQLVLVKPTVMCGQEGSVTCQHKLGQGEEMAWQNMDWPWGTRGSSDEQRHLSPPCPPSPPSPCGGSLPGVSDME